MATMKVPCDGFSLYSSWQCQNVTVANGQPTGRYEFKDKPSTDSKSVTFSASLPSGAVVTAVQVWATINSPFTGYSIRTANGNGFKLKYEKEVGAELSVEGFTGVVDVKFEYKANGNTVDTDKHISTIVFSDVYLWVVYDEPETEQAEEDEETLPAETFTVPPQSVCIYHQETGKIYMFDGVTKIQHTFSVKLEENAKADSVDKDKVINNATNEPDKLTLDVVMSDVYTDNANMTIANGWDADAQATAYSQSKDSIISDFPRSGNAVYVLRRLKEARQKLSVITPQYVHVDMLISNVTVSQDDSCPFGWVGQIEFQHAFRPKIKKDPGKSPTDTQDPTTSNGAELLVPDEVQKDGSGGKNDSTPTEKQTKTNRLAAESTKQTKAFIQKSIQ